MQSKRELALNCSIHGDQSSDTSVCPSSFHQSMDCEGVFTRWKSLDDNTENPKKHSMRSRRVLRRAKSWFCCFNPNVLLDESTNDSVLCFQQFNGSKSTPQKPVSRIYPSPESSEILIGPQLTDDLNKKTLVLDLDETLVHSSFNPLPSHDFFIPVDLDGQIKDVFVQKRPWLDQFLNRVCQKFEVVVFTASVSKYADPLLDQLESAKSVRWRLFRDACNTRNGNYVKDLSRLGRDLARTIIVDNSPSSYALQPGNAVPITGFLGDQTDRGLLEIWSILEDLSEAVDVRDSIKRSLGESPAILAAAAAAENTSNTMVLQKTNKK